MRKRKEPYTQIGITRVPCIRCGAPSTQQWQVCADGNTWRGLCLKCDIALNRAVLEFLKFPNVDELMEAYEARLRSLYGNKIT